MARSARRTSPVVSAMWILTLEPIATLKSVRSRLVCEPNRPHVTTVPMRGAAMIDAATGLRRTRLFERMQEESNVLEGASLCKLNC